MDAVLASLRQDRTPRAAVGEDILAAIRRGVRLRRVAPAPASASRAPDLESSIRAALRRIQRAAAHSDDDEEQERGPGEWER